MSNKSAYTYPVLRYVHDIATGEFLNVGVALLAPEHPDEVVDRTGSRAGDSGHRTE